MTHPANWHRIYGNTNLKEGVEPCKKSAAILLLINRINFSPIHLHGGGGGGLSGPFPTVFLPFISGMNNIKTYSPISTYQPSESSHSSPSNSPPSRDGLKVLRAISATLTSPLELNQKAPTYKYRPYFYFQINTFGHFRICLVCLTCLFCFLYLVIKTDKTDKAVKMNNSPWTGSRRLQINTLVSSNLWTFYKNILTSLFFQK